MKYSQIENLHILICLQDVETTTRKLSELDGRVEVAFEKKRRRKNDISFIFIVNFRTLINLDVSRPLFISSM